MYPKKREATPIIRDVSDCGGKGCFSDQALATNGAMTVVKIMVMTIAKGLRSEFRYATQNIRTESAIPSTEMLYLNEDGVESNAVI